MNKAIIAFIFVVASAVVASATVGYQRPQSYYSNYPVYPSAYQYGQSGYGYGRGYGYQNVVPAYSSYQPYYSSYYGSSYGPSYSPSYGAYPYQYQPYVRA